MSLLARCLPVAGLGLALALCAPAGARPITQAQPASSPAPIVSSRLASMAPADAYFGPFGMSPISIRTTIGLLGRQYHQRTISDHDLLRKALFTEDALRKWRSKYPADPWLAPTFYHLEQLYQAVQSTEARKHAAAILADVVRNYPNTKEGHLSRARQAAGFPPLVAESPLVATPQPATAADAAPSPAAADPSAAPAPAAPSASPSASPAPSSPAPSATPKP